MSQVKTVKIKDGASFRIINESDFKPGEHELYGDEALSAGPVMVNLAVGITPELQAAIDEAKAECEKVQAENVELKEQLATAHGELIAFKNDVTAMQAHIDELVPKAKKPTAAELKAAKAADDAKAAEQPEE
ncbi:hypothetical protein BEN74_04000 [Acinetobacter sp. WCHAc010034]|uniref:hypothetical protein n=1 Tax=Acinetobacter sp. WCHAc010034 TaxID=1879049 RepID=UPI00083A7B85|nr:hypothetical protein [Acinetobacter sp. WCHAc010034]AYA02113.1 hypothetical protein BEN74_04000 [Acinetobacter sp. WCHAc010034]